jgi:hypothetical protein
VFLYFHIRAVVLTKAVRKFMCEDKAVKQGFLLQAFPDTSYLFNDMNEMGDQLGYDVKKGMYVAIPSAHQLQ